MKKIMRSIFIVTLAASVIFGCGAYFLVQWAFTSIEVHQKSPLVLARGTPLRAYAWQLAEAEAISNPWMFYLWVKAHGSYQSFQAGTYLFKGSMSPDEIMQATISGNTYQAPLVTITIPEGFTLKQTINRLVANMIGDAKQLEALTRNKSLLQSYGINSESLEGFLYPATYSFYDKLPTGAEAIDTMVKKFFNMLPQGYLEQIAQMKLTLEQAVTFASLIEMEAFHDDEKPKVAEVIWNRLNKNMALAIDATLIYGIEDYRGDLTWAHLKDTKNRYNTRVHRGLPPTAIGSPSQSSLLAVTQPTHEGYYFYVLLSGNSKKHHFSKTLAEHNQYVRQLLKKENNSTIR